MHDLEQSHENSSKNMTTGSLRVAHSYASRDALVREVLSIWHDEENRRADSLVVIEWPCTCQLHHEYELMPPNSVLLRFCLSDVMPP